MASKTPSAKPSRPAPYRSIFAPLVTQPIADDEDIWESFGASRGSQYEESYQRIREREREERAARLRAMYASPPAPARPVVAAPAVKKPSRPLRITPDDVREVIGHQADEARQTATWNQMWNGHPPQSMARPYTPAPAVWPEPFAADDEDDSYVGEPIKPSVARTSKPRTPLPDDPTFMIGIEFEGILSDEAETAFKRALRDLVRDSYGDTLIQFGVDNSVKGYNTGFSPIEIRTAPMPLTQGLEAFELMLSFLYLASETGDWITNETCGLHLNVSERSVFRRKMQKTFYLNVLTAFDEMMVLEAFDRVDNRFCLPFWEDNDEPVCAETAELIYDEIKDRERTYLNAGSSGRETRESKYLACSLRDSPTHDSYNGPETNAQRIEFRCIGNEDYHLAFDQLDSCVNHMLDSVQNAYHAVRAAIPEGAPTKRRAALNA